MATIKSSALDKFEAIKDKSELYKYSNTLAMALKQ